MKKLILNSLSNLCIVLAFYLAGFTLLGLGIGIAIKAVQLVLAR